MSEMYEVERYESREAWLAARKSGLGASDTPPVLGFSRFKSAYSVATDKLTKAFDTEQDEMQEWGHRHEPSIARKFTEATHHKLSDPGEYTILRSKERPWLFCTPDRLLVDEDAELSIKTAYFSSGDAWLSGVPLSYQIQMQHTLYVTGYPKGYFAVLIDGYKFRWHSQARNEKWITAMLPKLDAFWEAIKAGKMPDVDGSMATAEALARRYPTPGHGIVEVPQEFSSLGDEYDALLKTNSENDKRKLEIQNVVKEIIGHNRVAVLMDQSGFAWEANGSGRKFRRIKKVSEVNG